MIKFDPVLGFVEESRLGDEVVELRNQVMMLEESWDDAAQSLLRLKQEDEGWRALGQVNQSTEGFSRDVLLKVTEKAEVQAVGNPLLKRAFELRYNPIFARGFVVEVTDGEKIKPRYQRKLDNPTVQALLFTSEGHEKLERLCYNVGNLFVAYNTVTGNVMNIPFKEITNRAVDPDQPDQTAYYCWDHVRTEFTGKTTPVSEYIPVVEWKASGRDTIDEIANTPVNHDWVIIDMRVNVPTTGHWGIPDVFPALGYAWAYSEYIRDASSLLKALTTFAWKVVGKNKAQAQAGGVQLATARKAGSVAAMTNGADFQSVPKAGLVDMGDGLALAAMVASATGVSTTSLISISQGGTAAAVASLDGPTVAMARARQERWVTFYNRLFLAMGIEDIHINFPKITEDPIHRQVSSLATGRATGAIWADEYREAFLEATSTKSLHANAPDVEEYAQAQNALGFLNWMEAETARIEAENDPLARQGNAGVAGNLSDGDNTNRNLDSKAGSGTQTDLVG